MYYFNSTLWFWSDIMVCGFKNTLSQFCQFNLFSEFGIFVVILFLAVCCKNHSVFSFGLKFESVSNWWIFEVYNNCYIRTTVHVWMVRICLFLLMLFLVLILSFHVMHVYLRFGIIENDSIWYYSDLSI